MPSDYPKDAGTHQRDESHQEPDGYDWPATTSPPDSLQESYGPGLDRLALQDPPQLVGQFGRGLKAPVGVLLQAFLHDRLEVSLHHAVVIPDKFRLLRLDLPHGQRIVGGSPDPVDRPQRE